MTKLTIIREIRPQTVRSGAYLLPGGGMVATTDKSSEGRAVKSIIGGV